MPAFHHFQIPVQLIPEVWLRAVLDDQHGVLIGRPSALVGDAKFGRHDLHGVLAVVRVAD
jgi:hypothetical protein